MTKNKTLFFVFSNKTHFETAIPIIQYFSKHYTFISIFNLSNQKYSTGLEQYLEQYKNLFQELLVIKRVSTKFARIKQLKEIKHFTLKGIKNHHIAASIQFIEGGDIDWLTIGVLKEYGVKTIVMQWAITWKPNVYDGLKNKKRFFLVKSLLGIALRKVLGLHYPKMKYLGDGNADYLVTMGDFWTKQFLQSYKNKDKFISVGNPRFLDLLNLRDRTDKNNILFVTGAATSLYEYSKINHLQDIEAVYKAYNSAGIQNRFIHKVHPRDIYLSDIMALSKKYYNIEVEQCSPVSNLLKKTLVTIIIRSTVGLEALVSGSKVIVFNNSNQTIGFNYAEYGLADEVSSSSALSQLLQDIQSIGYPVKDLLEFYVKTENIMKDLSCVIEKD